MGIKWDSTDSMFPVSLIAALAFHHSAPKSWSDLDFSFSQQQILLDLTSKHIQNQLLSTMSTAVISLWPPSSLQGVLSAHSSHMSSLGPMCPSPTCWEYWWRHRAQRYVPHGDCCGWRELPHSKLTHTPKDQFPPVTPWCKAAKTWPPHLW